MIITGCNHCGNKFEQPGEVIRIIVCPDCESAGHVGWSAFCLICHNGLSAGMPGGGKKERKYARKESTE